MNTIKLTIEFEDGATEQCLKREDGKIKVLADTFGGEYRNSWQTIKTTNKGSYIKLYGQREYIANDLEIQNTKV